MARQATHLWLRDIEWVDSPGGARRCVFSGTSSPNLSGRELVVELRAPGARTFEPVAVGVAGETTWSIETDDMVGASRVRFSGDEEHRSSVTATYVFPEPIEDCDHT